MLWQRIRMALLTGALVAMTGLTAFATEDEKGAPPPPAQVETIPPAPAGQPTYWQPGHWSWTSGGWMWVNGMYVTPPQPTAAWVPGQWVSQPTGGYVWVQGHWQS